MKKTLAVLQNFMSQHCCRKKFFHFFYCRKRKEFVLFFTIELEQPVANAHLQNHTGREFYCLCFLTSPKTSQSSVSLKNSIEGFYKDSRAKERAVCAQYLDWI